MSNVHIQEKSINLQQHVLIIKREMDWQTRLSKEFKTFPKYVKVGGGGG